MADQIELYGAARCPYTAEIREQLLWEQKTFVEYDVEDDTAALERMRRLTENGRMVPVLVENGRVTRIGWQGRGCLV